MKRIGKSKEPTIHAMKNIASNLESKLRCSILVETQVWYHISGNMEDRYRISVVSNSSGCEIYYYKTWPELLLGYRKLMKGEL